MVGWWKNFKERWGALDANASVAFMDKEETEESFLVLLKAGPSRSEIMKHWRAPQPMFTNLEEYSRQHPEAY